MKKDDIFPVDENDEDVMVTLSLDDGTEVSCEILTIFTAGARDYIVLLPLDQAGNPPEDGTVYIYRYEEDETGAPSLENILDDEEYALVEERYDELLDEAAFDEMD